jgi:hypothetical protein
VWSMVGCGPWLGVVHGWVWSMVGCGPWLGVVHGCLEAQHLPLQNMSIRPTLKMLQVYTFLV